MGVRIYLKLPHPWRSSEFMDAKRALQVSKVGIFPASCSSFFPNSRNCSST